MTYLEQDSLEFIIERNRYYVSVFVLQYEVGRLKWFNLESILTY